MKTSSIEVHDMLSVFSIDEVEKRIGEVPGVESVTVNFSAGNATVRYDETRLEIADIKSAVRQRGYELESPAEASAGEPHEGHSAADAAPAADAPMNASVVPATVNADAGSQDKSASSATPNPSPAEPTIAPGNSEGDAQKDTAEPDKN